MTEILPRICHLEIRIKILKRSLKLEYIKGKYVPQSIKNLSSANGSTAIDRKRISYSYFTQLLLVWYLFPCNTFWVDISSDILNSSAHYFQWSKNLVGEWHPAIYFASSNKYRLWIEFSLSTSELFFFFQTWVIFPPIFPYWNWKDNTTPSNFETVLTVLNW